jgi:ABC-type transport system substrate-binding protein/outer membrane protein assembly factor BamB
MIGKKSVMALGFVALLVLSVLYAIPVSSWVYPDCTMDARYEKFGPRCDGLLIKMYSMLEAECDAMEMCEIDVMDWPLRQPWIERWSTPPYDEIIKLVDYGCDLDEIVLEMNNNPNEYLGNPPDPAYPNPVYPNPCSVSSFRHALAHLMDRNYIISNIDEGFGIPMYTEVWPGSPTWLHPEILPGGMLDDLTHLYDPAEAARLLDEDDFPIGPDDWRYWDRNENGVKDPGEDLVLKFIIRTDDSKKMMIGDWYSDQLESDPIRIRVDRWYMSRIGCIIKVMVDKDFHLFIGDRNLRKDPDYLYEMKHSQMYWHPGICPNYIFFNDTEYDYWAEQLKFANTFDEALEAAYKCQEVYATPCKIGSIPIECRYGIKAMKRCYSGDTPEEMQYYGQDWKGFVNGYWAKCSCGGAMGINSWWTFLNAYPEGHLMGDCQHMTIRYGFSTSTLWSLNPIYAHDYWEWEVLNKIYDTLLKEDPYTLEDIPWMVKNWEFGTWIDPTTGEEKTKIRLTLRTDVTWQDGTPFSAADVKFTIEELPNILAERGFPPPWWHQKVKFVKSCDIIDPCNIEVLFDVKSIWALHWIGELKILPKHIWKPIVETGDPTGFAPDPNLIGCGPWRLADYVPGAYILLKANKPSSTIQTNLPGSVPIHSPHGYFRWCPVHVNVHISNPPEYEFAQKVLPNTAFTVKVTLHNEWVNPIPNTAEAPAHGLLTVHKYVWLVYSNGTQEILAEAIVDLPYCVPYVEHFPLNLTGCNHHQIKVAVHIDGPAEIEVTKEGGTIIVPNPWMCQWINYTFDFWITIKEDIVGAYYVDPQVLAPDGQVAFLDVYTCSLAFGSFPGHPRWEPLADIDRDYQITTNDVYAVARMFGWTCGMPYVPKIRNIAVVNVTALKTLICQGYPINVNVTIQNKGNWSETFSVNVNFNSSIVKTRTVSLDPGGLANFTLIVVPETFVFEELWKTSISELRSVDVSQDGRYVAFLSKDTIGIVHNGTIIASCSLPGTPETYWLDTTQDMSYIAITNGTGIEFYGFDGVTLQWTAGTTLIGKTAEVRLSENKTYAAAPSGTRMNAINATTGDILWSYDAGAEQFACDGDDNLNYIIGGTQTPPYKYFILKNLGNSYQLLAEGSMTESINDLDSTPDGSYFAFGSDAGEYLLLKRIGDTIETVLSGTVKYLGIIKLPVESIEIGNGTLLVGAPNLVNLYDFNGTLILHHEYPLSLLPPLETKATVADYDGGIYVIGTNTGDLCFIRETGPRYGEISLGAEPVRDVRIEDRYIVAAQGDNVFLLNFSLISEPLLKGNYTVSANADILPFEVDVADNSKIDGCVFVAIVGDINADGIVDIEDIYLIALAYGTMPGQPGYKPNLDVNGDKIVDIEDIYTTALHYGEMDP